MGVGIGGWLGKAGRGGGGAVTGIGGRVRGLRGRCLGGTGLRGEVERLGTVLGWVVGLRNARVWRTD